jgi:NPCBM/NEW2 domain
MKDRLLTLRASIALFALGMAAPAFGADSGVASSSEPVFTALLIDGQTVSGRLVALGPAEIKLSSSAETVHNLPLERVVKITCDVPVLAPATDRSHVVLPGGDCLTRVGIGISTDTSLELQSDALGKLKVPLDAILGLLISTPSQISELDALWERIRLEPRATEVVWLANGDRLAGEFLGIDEQKVKIQVDGKPVEVERSEVRAVGFNPALVDYPRPKPSFVEVTLKDGTRLGLSGAKLDEASISGTTRFGQAVRISLSELAQLHARTSKVVYLSERKPAQVQYRSYVGPTREYRLDRTVDGRPFHLAGQYYDRGIGTQSRTLIAYEVEPGDRRFQALVGLDEGAGPLGSVVFRVLIDGKERKRTPPLGAHDSPQTFDVDLTGARFLILDTAFGDRGDVRDLADWVEARVIR